MRSTTSSGETTNGTVPSSHAQLCAWAETRPSVQSAAAASARSLMTSGSLPLRAPHGALWRARAGKHLAFDTLPANAAQQAMDAVAPGQPAFDHDVDVLPEEPRGFNRGRRTVVPAWGRIGRNACLDHLEALFD